MQQQQNEYIPETGETFIVRQRIRPRKRSPELLSLAQARPVSSVLFKYDSCRPWEALQTGAFPLEKGSRFCDFSKRLEKHWFVTLESHLDPDVIAGRRSAWHLERSDLYLRCIARGDRIVSWWGQQAHLDPDYVYENDSDSDSDSEPSWKDAAPISSRTRSSLSH